MDQAIQIDPKYAMAYYNRGNAYRKLGQYQQAMKDYDQAVRLDPKYAGAYNNIAWILATCPDSIYRDGKRAIELAGKALELKKSASYFDTLAAAYAEDNRFKDAIRTQKKAMELLKKEEKMEKPEEFKERLESYKSGKPWRE